MSERSPDAIKFALRWSAAIARRDSSGTRLLASAYDEAFSLLLEKIATLETEIERLKND